MATTVAKSVRQEATWGIESANFCSGGKVGRVNGDVIKYQVFIGSAAHRRKSSTCLSLISPNLDSSEHTIRGCRSFSMDGNAEYQSMGVLQPL